MGVDFIESFDGIGTTAASIGGKGWGNWGVNGPGAIVSARFGNGLSVGNNQWTSHELRGNTNKIWCGFAVNLSGLSGGPWVEFGDVTNVQMRVLFDVATMKIQVHRGSTLLATSTASLSASTWYYIEFYAKIHDTTGEYSVRVNGQVLSELTASGVNTKGYSGSTNINRFRLVGYSGATWILDDIYVLNDATGLTGFQGDSRMYANVPTSDGSHLDFTPDSGVTHYTQVDEAGYDSDTSYVGDGTPGHYDLYGYGALPVGVGPIVAAQITLVARKDDVASHTVQAKLKSGTTVVNGSRTLTMSTTYQAHQDTWETNPDTGAAWSRTSLNAIELGPLVNA